MTEQRHAALGIHAADANDSPDAIHLADPLQRKQVARRIRWLTVVVLVLLALGGGRTVISRMGNARALEAGTTERAKQYVKTTLPKTAEAGQTLALPGTLQGFVQSPIAARAAGYLRRWTKDIGARVEKGEVLAEIESPELDQQLSQAVAAREQAASGLQLATSTVERWESLRKKDVVSQQDLDERRGSAAQARANLAAADANVQRLRQLEGFKRVVAPFAGVITRRYVDVGDLIDMSGKPLFTLSQTDPLRVYVNVPQSSAQLVKPGQPVVVTQGELRGQSFKGTVARTAASIDTGTRTMQVEIALPNPNGTLLPGAYVQVALPLSASQAMLVPTNALLFRAEGARVAVVDGTGRVTLKAVTLGRNYGESVEVIDGLAADQRLVLNPSDSLADGDQVTVAAAASAPASAPKGSL
ncbi:MULTISPECIES: efflux RND transporter periplasmic adaptor subunit [unclassified Rhizobacter]|uniref:efflux RND transporter periplasmic adaptor subunit n=1 Tax=unclassified Rhizobacter TaxID=2640088 RepID=UPI0006FF4791|nr:MULTISPECIES: efflux RND transporter periplasmic adaptor subunit [unclassified Rhizobacter]KQU78367.1 RND transporter MFP subunit [Rhizobacter sp. Root29]KQW10887.1 RND transporter MFP subunit [Rhizobacter sp. Root1238]KRB25233.1 RND transporter MFP subunit [Rhizobacter sp. Root16D2]